MRLYTVPRSSLPLLSPCPPLIGAQAQTETARKVEGGGISVAGWTGKIDATKRRPDRMLNNAKLAADGAALHVTTGPAVTYWNPANKAAGNYTVKATFNEPKYMSLNDHPHPYGIVIGGNDLGTPQQSYLYCAAYGNGNFIVRGFGPAPFQMNGRRGETERGGEQGGRAGRAGDAGDRDVGQGRQRRVRDQRHGRRQLRQGRARRRRQAEVHRRRLRHPLRAQHRSDGHRVGDDEELVGRWAGRTGGAGEADRS